MRSTSPSAPGCAGPLGPSGRRGERGNTLVFVSLTMVVLMVFAAFGVDLGMVYAERRTDQGAADTGVLGGSQNLATGVTSFSEEAARIVRTNLNQTYTDTQWQALWAACTDASKKQYTGTVLGTSTQCISVDGTGVARVRVPDQIITTSFAQVFGVDTMRASAFAEAGLDIPGIGGILPFALLAGTGGGAEVCLRSGTGGQAREPCTGPDAGNFGAIESPQYGNTAFNTQGLPCNVPKDDQLAVNISIGIDHFIRPHTGTDIQDTCAKPFGPTMLNTFQGISGGLEEGFLTGITVSGRDFPGRLTLGSGPFRTLEPGQGSVSVDNQPLWSFIPTGKGTTVPTSCQRETFDALGTDQAAGSAKTQNLRLCMAQYAAGTGYGTLFDLDSDGDDQYDILQTPRFGIVPQFQETEFPNGNSNYLRIGGFRAVFIQTLSFGCTGGNDSDPCDISFDPGTGNGAVQIGNEALDQVSGFLLPLGAIPNELFANGPAGALGPWQALLSR